MADPSGSVPPSGDPDTGAAPPMLEVGRVLRAHGLAGEVVVDLWSNRPGRLDPGSVLWCRGVPRRVVASRPHRDRHLVRFSGIGDRSGAEQLRGCVLEGPVPPDVDAVSGASGAGGANGASGGAGSVTLWVHEVVGAVVVDLHDTVLGTVVEMEANPASDLLVLDSGALVPLCFVVGGVSGGRLLVDVPEGLIADPPGP